jgi:hypothetical protein
MSSRIVGTSVLSSYTICSLPQSRETIPLIYDIWWYCYQDSAVFMINFLLLLLGNTVSQPQKSQATAPESLVPPESGSKLRK